MTEAGSSMWMSAYTKPFSFIHSNLLYKADQVMMEVTTEIFVQGDASVGGKGSVSLGVTAEMSI